MDRVCGRLTGAIPDRRSPKSQILCFRGGYSNKKTVRTCINHIDNSESYCTLFFSPDAAASLISRCDRCVAGPHVRQPLNVSDEAVFCTPSAVARGHRSQTCCGSLVDQALHLCTIPAEPTYKDLDNTTEKPPVPNPRPLSAYFASTMSYSHYNRSSNNAGYQGGASRGTRKPSYSTTTNTVSLPPDRDLMEGLPSIAIRTISKPQVDVSVGNAVKPEDVKYVGSYNWVEESTPTIIVPGAYNRLPSQNRAQHC